MKEIEPRKSVNAPALFQNLAHASNLGDGDGEETGDGDGDDDGEETGCDGDLRCKNYGYFQLFSSIPDICHFYTHTFWVLEILHSESA